MYPPPPPLETGYSIPLSSNSRIIMIVMTMSGALAAAEWLPGRPGVHRFESMLFGGSG